MKKIYTLLFLFLATSTQAQTTINTGDVSGTWNKAGSPYLINGHINVPLGKSLIITEGVTIEFQGAYMLNVYGHMNVLGKEKDTVLFTPKDKNIGWQGIYIHKNTTDTFKFNYGKFEHVKFFSLSNPAGKHGPLRLDYVSFSKINHCVFTKSRTNGGSVFGFRSDLNIRNSMFRFNNTTDTIINGKKEVAGGAAIIISKSKLHMNNCNISDNISSLDILHLIFSTGVDIKKCTFSRNKIIGIQVGNTFRKAILSIKNNSKQKLLFKIDSCNFKFNNLEGGSTVVLDNQYAENFELQVSNSMFYKNLSPKSFTYGPDFYNYGIQGFKNKVKILNSEFIKSSSNGTQGVRFNRTNNLNTVKEVLFLGSNTYGLYMEGSVQNSIFTNNVKGVTFESNSNKNIINNCIIANNNYGIIASNSGIQAKAKLYNNIITGNRDTLNKMSNLNTESGKFTEVNNNIIEGGKNGSIAFGNKPNIGTYTNNIDQAPIFMKPSKGVGPAFYDSTADWHLKNTCTQIPLGYNKGTTDIRDANNKLIPMPTYDLDGNPRIQGGQIDIGPYEMAGLKSEVSVYKQPKDTAACPNNTVNFDATVLGIALNYQWQQSTDKNTWSNINLANKPSLDTKNTTTNYYRLVATQKECKKADTTDAAKLSIHTLPTPNLGADKDLKDNATLKLDAGKFDTYQWNNNKTSQTITLDGSTMALGKALFWVEVTNTKGCKGADSIVITVKKSDGLFDVQTLPNINIYPNPAGHSIQLAGNLAYPMDIKIVNLNGQTLINKTLNNAQAIDISALEQGIYTLISTNKNGSFSAKLVVE